MKKKGKTKGVLLGGAVGAGVGIIAVAVFFVLAFLGMMWFMTKADHNEFVRQIYPSPNGEYQAEVVNYEEGIIGGSTYVYVSKVSERTEPCVVDELYTDKGERIAGADYDAYSYLTVTWSDELHFQIELDYGSSRPHQVMDVDLSGDKVESSGWYDKEE